MPSADWGVEPDGHDLLAVVDEHFDAVAVQQNAELEGAILTAAGATAADGAECILTPQSQSTAARCGMCPTAEVLEGAIRFYAQSLPAENMTMPVRLIPGAPEQEG